MQTNSLLRPRSHLSYQEIKHRYQTADTKRHQRYWNLIRLMSDPDQPLTVKKAAHAAGFSQRWARQLVHRYNANGPGRYVDQRVNNPGQKPLLTKQQQTKLRRAVSSGQSPDGGLWTSVKVADWISEQTGVRPSDQTGLNYLYDLGFSLHVPRPRHTNAPDEAATAAFKKSSNKTVESSNVIFQTKRWRSGAKMRDAWD